MTDEEILSAASDHAHQEGFGVVVESVSDFVAGANFVNTELKTVVAIGVEMQREVNRKLSAENIKLTNDVKFANLQLETIRGQRDDAMQRVEQLESKGTNALEQKTCTSPVCCGTGCHTPE